MGRAHELFPIPDHRGIGDAGNGHQEFLQKLRLDQRAVPLRRIVIIHDQAVGQLRHSAIDHALRLCLQLFAPFERVQALRVDDLALLVHDVIELEQLLACLEVLQLDALLRLADRRRDPRMGDDFAFLGAGAIHDAGNAVGAEQPHQVVFEREKEDALPRIALAPRPAAQLAVDAPRLVPLGPDDDEAARRILVALVLFELRVAEIGLFDRLAERGLARLDPAHLTLLHAEAEFDVGAAAGHVGRDRDGPGLSRLRHDFGFALVILGVQYFVLQAAPLHQARQCFRHFDVRRADQNRQAALVLALDLLHDRVVLLLARLVDEVVLVHPPHRPVGGNHRDVELVDLMELGLFGLGGPGHAGELLVHAEVVLDRDGGEGLRLLSYGNAFLGLHGLVQTVRPAAPGHQPAGELVHDEDLAVLHDVLDVFLVQRVRLEQLVDDVQRLALRRVFGFHHAAPFDLLLRREVGVVLQLVDGVRDVGHDEERRILRRHRLDALVGEVHGPAALVHDEVQVVLDVPHLLIARRQLAVGQAVELHALDLLFDALLVQQLQQLLVLRHAELRLVEQRRTFVSRIRVPQQRLRLRDEIVRDGGLLAHQLHDLRVELRVLLVRLGAHRAGDDQRGARLVDQDGIDFVDDRVDVRTLNPLLQAPHHVVAEIVEPELVVRAVRDVALVGGASLGAAGLGVVDAPDGEAEPLEEMAHPLRVAPRQIVVDGHEMRAAARQGVEVQRQRRDQRLPLARRHFGDFALVQHDPADELHIVGHHVPLQRVPRHDNLAAQQPAGRLANGRERFGQHIVERLLQLGNERLLGCA